MNNKILLIALVAFTFVIPDKQVKARSNYNLDCIHHGAQVGSAYGSCDLVFEPFYSIFTSVDKNSTHNPDCFEERISPNNGGY